MEIFFYFCRNFVTWNIESNEKEMDFFCNDMRTDLILFME